MKLDPKDHQKLLNSSPWWISLLIFALLEVIAHGMTQLHIPEFNDWVKAANHVRKEYRNGDALTIAPGWADPILRWVLGDRITLADAGRSDLEGYQRLWTLSIRKAVPSEAPNRVADETTRFGKVTLKRWNLSQNHVLFDLVQQVHEAEVSFVKDGREKPCVLRRLSPPRGGGLGIGLLPPSLRFVCDERKPWIYVSQAVLEDLSLSPRYCVYQPPAGKEPVRVTFQNVPLGDHLDFYAGLYYEHERYQKGSPVRAIIRIDGQPLGQMVHRDGEGWKYIRIPSGTRSRQNRRGDISIEVTASDPNKRSFCWSAKTILQVAP